MVMSGKGWDERLNDNPGHLKQQSHRFPDGLAAWTLAAVSLS